VASHCTVFELGVTVHGECEWLCSSIEVPRGTCVEDGSIFTRNRLQMPHELVRSVKTEMFK
jgi:hypothetical protein